MGRLSGKVAVITGTASGQGRAAALLFASEGAQIAGCDLNVDGARQTMEMVRGAGGKMISSAPVDLASEQDVKAWIEDVVKHYGGIDILYNNAGNARVGWPFAIAPLEDWRFTMRNEVDVVYFPTRAAWPHLVKRGGGSIINVSSIVAQRGTDLPMSAHGAAKGAVASLSRHLAIEGGPLNIRVNTISPGLIDTPQTNIYLKDPTSLIHKQVRTAPLGRVGRSEDVAELALFLASDGAGYITGTDITVDGGQTLGVGMSFGAETQSKHAGVNEQLKSTINVSAKLDVATKDGTADCYIFQPDGEGPWPGVLMYTDIMGVRPVFMAMAQRLSRAGFVVMLPNLFYRVGLPFDPPLSVHSSAELGKLLTLAAALTSDVIKADAPAYVDALRSHRGVAAGPISCVGYCMSGSMAVWTAEVVPDQVKAVMTFHGGGLAIPTPDNPAEAATRTKAKYYFGLAETDPFMPPEAVQSLTQTLDAAKVQYKTEVYPNTFHGFAVRDGSYNEAAAERHFDRMKEFLLGMPPT